MAPEKGHNVANGPLAISRLGETDTREAQNTRAIKWLLEQEGGTVVVVTPRREFSGESLKRLVAHPGVSHYVWRGFSGGSFAGHRVLHAWPDRKHFNDVWEAKADALVVIEWNTNESTEWIADSNPLQLFPEGSVTPDPQQRAELEPLPEDVERILEHIAHMATGYSTGLKWNEEDKLKADMMNRPQRWKSVTVEQVRSKCRELGMSPADADTVAGYVQRRKEGRRFNVQSSYRTFHFN